ncbi:MAG: hypothetical protein ACREIP_19375, partial [Alphaproteobacteria bacterium]
MKRTQLFFALIAGAAVAIGASAPAKAEIEPKYYRQMQDRAPEVATVRVLSVKSGTTRDKHHSGSFTLVNTRVVAEARVESVQKTSTGLKAGDTIRIEYVTTRPEPPMPGPRPIPVLKDGQTYPVFLVGVSKGVYGAA